MNKKSTSRSAFFNPRVLIALSVVLTGVFLALLSSGAFSAAAQNIIKGMTKGKVITHSTDPLVPVGFDCSRIYELGIDKQENFRAGAIMIACGEVPGSATSATSTLGPIGRFIKNLLLPLAYGAADKNLITGTETSPNITQSETYTSANPDNPNQIVVAYNDSRGRNVNPINISGASVSTDGGTTFTRLTNASGQSPFSGTEGDPVVLYNKPTGTWFTVWLDTGCGGQGLGGYKSTTPWDPSAASWTHFCVHNNSNDDRESGWVDNNPSSPFFGRMYVSWNDFNVASGALFVTYSSDNGATWHAPISVFSSFVRDVQITGDKVTGDVYIAAMNENGGNGNFNRNNLIYRSTDGGNTWTNTYTGPTFTGAHRTNSGYFACMYNNPAYWRHMGWGEPAAYNQVVSYVYAAGNTSNGDPGDVFYIRSTNSGVTFSAPFQLNTDTDHTKAQWQPNLSVSEAGTLFATWYDETPRVAASCQPSSPSTPCYRMYSRKSNDNGATWLLPDTLSEVDSPLPLQPDPGIQPLYVGDYDYGSAILTKHVTSWADGRNAINNASQQDAFTDRELIGFGVTSTNPACNSVINTQPVDFIVNLTDGLNPGTVQATDFTVDGTPADSFALSNGNSTIAFHYNSTPVATQGSHTMHIPAGAFNRASDGTPNLDFTCTFRYDVLSLQVTTTVPAVGDAFSPPAPNNYQYDINWNEPVNPASVQTSDLTLTGNAGGSVTAVTVINGNMTTRFTVHFNFGGNATASIGAGSLSDAFGNPNAAFTGNYTVQGCPPQDHYVVTQIGGSIVPGTIDTGNHGDDVVTNIALPFSYNLYGTNYSSINLSSNGNAQFTTTDTDFSNVCLPWLTHNSSIFPYWDDLRTDLMAGCVAYPGGACGIYTSISGSAPNRIFNIEWRAVYFSNNIQLANHELRLYEGQTRFDVIYGTVAQGNNATAGVQKNDTAFDQYFCNGSGGTANGGQSYTLQACGTPSPTPTATANATATPTATATSTPTATATATPTCTRPSAPNAQSAINITFSSFTARWSSANGATGYRLDVSTSNTFATYVPGYQDLDVQNVTSYPVTGLSANTIYYYRVRAYNACATSSNSSVKNVRTATCTPKAPSVRSATNVTFSSFTAQWSSVSGGIDYRLDVATDSAFNNFVPNYQDLHVGNVTSYPVTGLSANTIYYYRVRSYNGCNTSPNSNVKSVQTSP